MYSSHQAHQTTHVPMASFPSKHSQKSASGHPRAKLCVADADSPVLDRWPANENAGSAAKTRWEGFYKLCSVCLSDRGNRVRRCTKSYDVGCAQRCPLHVSLKLRCHAPAFQASAHQQQLQDECGTFVYSHWCLAMETGAARCCVEGHGVLLGVLPSAF